ncbi:MAG: YceI family protein [Wenzhouxiangellaceae bacterium]
MRLTRSCLLGLSMLLSAPLYAEVEHYKIDTSGAHAFVTFKISHLGFSWIQGRFNDFDGEFRFDPENPQAAYLNMTVDVGSIDTNHAERDKHLRSDDFFAVDEHPQASFVSTAYRRTDDGQGQLEGELTIRGTTQKVTLDVQELAAGNDPWGGYRRGYSASTTLQLEDFGLRVVSPASATAELTVTLEGIRQ